MGTPDNATPAGRAASPVRVAFVQDGARLHYAVPLALQRAGLLERVFTEVYSSPGSAEALVARLARPLAPSVARRLGSRHCPELDAGRVVHNPWLVLPEQIVRMLSPTPEDFFRRASHLVGRWVQRAGWGRANVLMGFVRNIDPHLCRVARRRGLTVVADQMIAPARVEHNEASLQLERFPGWESPSQLLRVEPVEHATWAALNHVTAPSEYVRAGLIAQGVAPEKISILPYPMTAGWIQYTERPAERQPVTVGFIGRVNLRKGAPYFFQMARRFPPEQVRFVMVGPIDVSPQVVKQHAGAVQLVGPKSRAEVGSWLEQFDVFYFPSTCEGSAGVVMEAMMSGLPVIATPNSGTVIRHGLDGYLTAYDDLDGAAAHLEQLIRDADLRRRLGRAAHERAKAFDVDAYGWPLASLLGQLLGQPPHQCGAR